jgi:preprotein translocase subunit SecA
MNSQREVVYKRRRHALYGDRLQVDIVNMIYDTCNLLIRENKPSNDYQNFEFELIRFSSTTAPFKEDEFKTGTEQELTDQLFDVVYKHYKEKLERNAKAAFPVIKDVYENHGEKYERIVVPFTDGTKELKVVTNLKTAYETGGKELVTDFEKNITLAIIDDTWKDHLRQMDELKQSVQNATYEQKDPLLIYKFESFELFNGMLDTVNKEVLSFLFKGELPSQDATRVLPAREQKREKVQLSKEEYGSSSPNQQTNQTQAPKIVETIVRTERKIGRNEQVTIKHVLSGENKSVKYKQAIPLIDKGDWVLVE